MKLYLKSKDFTLSGETFQLLYDSKRDMLITDPQPKDLSKYYESDEYISHTDSAVSLLDKVYQFVKQLNLRSKLSLINSNSCGDKSLLDIGAGTGDFLAFSKTKGWKVVGVEPNKRAQNKAAEKGVDLKDNLKALPEQHFDVITLWHVLEHLPDLDKQIAEMVSLLKDNGTLIVAVPNYKSFDAGFYKNFWAAFDVPRHLWHFSRKSIPIVFDKHGMKVVKTKPMIFDAFYVSLLSEKYRTGKQHFFRAFCVGLYSNIKALWSKEYSSVIYILKRA
ncbi:class I SAM-dependent methyltransferase [Arenibacter aquaticus]|uniref:Class I SAM-dependent methyltransferase n=1 Tax=Arenibacter aquaticus TaxID=2489054 RepID=A0A430K717_9FLAO|nr:class I SAM-dependent methyltransferase [Arenibacter aquaticus]RTE54848.1 class I SAM-dependent methyltransferase [Arenibacter aquaticus]